jgi:DnaJ like chaperone protein
MKLLVLFIAGFIFYYINRKYKSEDFLNINIDVKQKLQGNLREHEAGLLIALMAKVAKADGHICELEAQLLSHTFTDIASHFEDSQNIREQLKEIYKTELNTFDNTIIISTKYLKLSKNDYNKRLKVMEYLLNLSFIDQEFSQAEQMITQDIANALEISNKDFENLINEFKTFYENIKEQKSNSIENAYKILGANENEDITTIKKKYKTLVRKNHPDIIMGQGASQSIIDKATKKLQEINSAYELIKERRA